LTRSVAVLVNLSWIRSAFGCANGQGASALVQIAAQHIRHMQKSLTQMNLQIHWPQAQTNGRPYPGQG
jgi:hypothetical protein